MTSNKSKITKTKATKAKRSKTSATVGSMARAAAMLTTMGIEVAKEDLIEASQAGAPGFDASGRVNLTLLAPWLRANPLGDSELASLRNLRRQTLGQKLADLRREAGLADDALVARAAVSQMFAQYISAVAPMLRQKMGNEWPAQVVGMPLEQIRKMGRDHAEGIIAKMRACAEVFEC